METAIKDILNVLGMGIYGIMPNCVDNWCGRLKSFFPSFQVVCTNNTDAEKVFTLSSSVDNVIQIRYSLNGAHITSVDVYKV